MQMFVKKMESLMEEELVKQLRVLTYNIWTLVSIDLPKRTCVLWILSLQIDMCHTIFKTGKLENNT
jgi:hypothetical protein